MYAIRSYYDGYSPWLHPTVWMGPSLLTLLLFGVLVVSLSSLGSAGIGETAVDAKQVGISLFGPYVLVVELASLLLLAAMVTAYHLGREQHPAERHTQHREGDKSSYNFV